jgi:hypothetical protein
VPLARLSARRVARIFGPTASSIGSPRSFAISALRVAHPTPGGAASSRSRPATSIDRAAACETSSSSPVIVRSRRRNDTSTATPARSASSLVSYDRRGSKSAAQLLSSLKRLSRLASAPAGLPPASAAAKQDSNDAIALSLAAQINRITELAGEIGRTRVRPSEEVMEALLEEGWGGESRYPTDDAWTAACGLIGAIRL